MKPVNLSLDFIEGHQTLECPACGAHFLHQGRVEVFDRREDAIVGHHATITPEGVTVDHSQDGNPSRRRDGIRITFSCELCEAEPVLTIVQHKGSTYVEWEAR